MLDYSIYHIRMDTLETQKQFGLWWACHSISRLKSLIQRGSDPKCRNNIVVFTNNNAKHWWKCFDTLSNKLWKQYPPKSWTISEPSTSSCTSSQRKPMSHEVSFLPSLLPSCLPSFLASFLPSFLPSLLPSFLPSLYFLMLINFFWCKLSFFLMPLPDLGNFGFEMSWGESRW